jgi:hypothetical protein
MPGAALDLVRKIERPKVCATRCHHKTADDGRLASPRVGDNDERQEEDGCDVVHTVCGVFYQTENARPIS